MTRLFGKDFFLFLACPLAVYTVKKDGAGPVRLFPPPRLSAYCGAVSAGAGAASGIAYLQGGRFETIAHVIVNTVAVTSGIVCDGAKASCAAKIAAAVDAGLLGLAMVRDGNEFYGGDGIVKKGVENTIAIVGRLARNGMLETDKEIIRLMLE